MTFFFTLPAGKVGRYRFLSVGLSRKRLGWCLRVWPGLEEATRDRRRRGFDGLRAFTATIWSLVGVMNGVLGGVWGA